jgi:hypothetical protein
MEIIILFNIISIPALIFITGWRSKMMTDKLHIHPLSGFHPEKTGSKYIPPLSVMEY